MNGRPRSSWALPLFGASLVAFACASQGGRAAAQLGAAVANAATRSGGLPEREPWSTRRSRCAPFDEYSMSCPVLPDCRGMARDTSLSINACDSGSGFLKPIRVCTDWQKRAYWCASGSFPRCERLIGARCGPMDTMVCDDVSGIRRVVVCCSGAAGGSDCVSNAYYELRRRDAPATVPTGDSGSASDAAFVEPSDAEAADARGRDSASPADSAPD